MLALVAALSALAQTQNPYLDEGRRLFNALKYAEAIVQLEVARQVPGLSDAQELEALELLARSQVAEGRRADAEKTFSELLLRAPAFAPDRTLSPKILEAFDAAKERVFPKDYLKLDALTSAPGLARLRVIDPWQRAASFELDARLEGEPAWRLEPVTPEHGVLYLKLAAPPLRTLEWYVVARNAAGDRVGGFGTSHEPQRLVAAPIALAPSEEPVVVSTSTPREKRALGWALSVGAVAAAVVGGVFQGQSLRESNAAHDRLQTPYAADARAAQNGAMRDAAVATACFIGAGLLGAGGVVVFAW